MTILAAMPRETNTSLFTSHVTQGIFVTFCLIGLTFTCLVFFQNYKYWSDRREEIKRTQKDDEEAMKSANHDFYNSILVSLIIVVFFLFIVFDFVF